MKRTKKEQRKREKREIKEHGIGSVIRNRKKRRSIKKIEARTKEIAMKY